MIQKQFESSSSNATYKAWFDPATNEDGCDCPGWRFKRPTGPRRCKHTDELRADVKPGAIPLVAPAPRTGASGIPEPMLASPLKDDLGNPVEWIAEEKYDGHRILVRVKGKTINAVSRLDNNRILPAHIQTVLLTFPDGVYDGELMAVNKTGKATSSAVADKANEDKLHYVIFDILEMEGNDVTRLPYTDRRMMLDLIFGQRQSPRVVKAELYDIVTAHDIQKHTLTVWGRGGEGLILKRRSSTYQPGRRSTDWLKIKMLQTAVLTIVGYAPGKNGPHSTVVLEDDEGNMTTVKVLNNKEHDRLNKEPHKAIGRRLRIEFQERTADGSYRHPRWDRYEDE